MTPPTAAALVFLHHAYAAAADPSVIYNHRQAVDSPFLWSLIHSGLFLAICVTSVVHWNIHEKSRAAQRVLMDRLQQLAFHDPLTGLANRELLQRRLTDVLAATDPPGAPAGLLMLDVDGFKNINDMHGHGAGDIFLKNVAQRLLESSRATDTVARLGGDEFAIVLPNTTAHDAALTAQRILVRMAEPLITDGRATSIGVSIGIALSRTGQKPHELMNDADKALYATKRNGRGRFTTFSPEIAAGSREALPVRVSDARAWAAYTSDLRTEIAAAKTARRLPAQTRGPDSAYRTLEAILDSIGHLPDGTENAMLPLPERTPLEEFLFHHDLVQTWAGGLTAKGDLTAHRSAAAEQFWQKLTQAITGTRPSEHALTTSHPRTTNTPAPRPES